LGTSLHVAPYIPLASAVVLLIVSQFAWVTLHVAFSNDGAFDGAFSVQNTFDMPITGWSGLLELLTQTPLIALARLTLFLWDVFPIMGIVLCLILLWQRRVALGLLVLYGGWLLLTTLICLLIITHALTMPFPFPCAPGDPVCPQTQVVSRSVDFGGWLALSCLALSWLAFGVLIYRQRAFVVGSALASAPVRSAPVVGYPPLRRLGAGVFTLGALLWAVGLYAVPWATSGCAGLQFSLNHFVRGSCSGVDGYDVLTAGLGAKSSLAWPLLELASVVGLFVVVAFWLPRLTRATWVVALGWVLLVTLMAFIGIHGIQVTIASGPHFSVDEVPWEASYGFGICEVGIVISLVSVALLACEEIVRARQVQQPWPQPVQRA
jgi:hypothetical protein